MSAWMDVAEVLTTVPKLKGITDDLSDVERETIGRAVRLEIHFTDPLSLRKQAEIMAGLAESIKAFSQRRDLSSYSILMALKGECMRARKRMLSAAARKSKKTDMDPLPDY